MRTFSFIFNPLHNFYLSFPLLYKDYHPDFHHCYSQFSHSQHSHPISHVPTLIPRIPIIPTPISCIPTLIAPIPIIPILIPCIPTLIPRIPIIPTLILHIPILIPPISIILLIPFPDSPLHGFYKQIAKCCSFWTKKR